MAASNGNQPEPHEPTITVTKRTDRTLLTALLHTILKPIGGKLLQMKETYPSGSPHLEPPRKVKKRCDVTERKVEDIYLYDVIPKAAAQTKTAKKRIYYFAGGGWQMPASGEHWGLLAEMAMKLPEAVVTLVSYPLAPRNPAAVAFPMLLKLYRTLMEDSLATGEEVILAGDSAGGNVVLSLVVNALLEEPESPCPKAILAISPSTDLGRGNPDIKEIEKSDPILNVGFIESTANAWRGDLDASDTRVSPLYADVGVLAERGVKVHGVTGSYDILSPDAILFRNKCNEAWIGGEWLDWDKQMHVFPLIFAYKLRESAEAKDWILDVLRRT